MVIVLHWLDIAIMSIPFDTQSGGVVDICYNYFFLNLKLKKCTVFHHPPLVSFTQQVYDMEEQRKKNSMRNIFKQCMLSNYNYMYHSNHTPPYVIIHFAGSHMMDDSKPCWCCCGVIRKIIIEFQNLLGNNVIRYDSRSFR